MEVVKVPSANWKGTGAPFLASNVGIIMHVHSTLADLSPATLLAPYAPNRLNEGI